MRTIFEVIRDEICRADMGGIITRKSFIKALAKEGYSQTSNLFAIPNQPFSLAYMDRIRNMFEKLGYINKTGKPGVYKVVLYPWSYKSVYALQNAYNAWIKNK